MVESLYGALAEGLRPAARHLLLVTGEASDRATVISARLSRLDAEHKRILLLKGLLKDMRTIQAVLGRGASATDDGFIEEALMLAAVSQEAILAYEERYGSGTARGDFERILKCAQEQLFSRLALLFEDDQDAQQQLDEVRLQALVEVLTGLKRLGAGEEGWARYGELLRGRFRVSVDRSLQELKNVQLPYAGRLALLFDSASGLLAWNFANLLETSDVMSICNDPILMEAADKASSVVNSFLKTILGSREHLDSDLRLLDLALIEAVSLLRQLLAFHRRHDLQAVSPKMALIEEQVVEQYRLLEISYLQKAIERAMASMEPNRQGPTSTMLVQDIIFLGQKVVRRAMGGLETGTIKAVMLELHRLLSEAVLPIIGRRISADKALFCNFLSSCSVLLESLASRLEEELLELEGELWAARILTDSSRPMNPRYEVADFRRLSDVLEGQLQAVLLSHILAGRPFSDHMAASVQLTDRLFLHFDEMDEELSDSKAEIVFASAEKAVALASTGLIPDVTRRVWLAAAAHIVDHWKKRLAGVQRGAKSILVLERNVRVLNKMFSAATETASRELFQDLLIMINERLE